VNRECLYNSAGHKVLLGCRRCRCRPSTDAPYISRTISHVVQSFVRPLKTVRTSSLRLQSLLAVAAAVDCLPARGCDDLIPTIGPSPRRYRSYVDGRAVD